MTKALVTGATRAPGRAIATTLAKEGWEVHALGRDRIALDDMRAGHGIVPLAMDLTDRDYVRLTVEGMEPDVVVHAALRWPQETRFLGLAEADIDMALEVNLSATLHVTRAVLPAMTERGHGAFVMLVPDECEAKSALERTAAGAIDGFARALADEVRGSGVFVHALALGRPPFHRLGPQVLSLLSASGFQSHFIERQEHGHGP
ncbi:SDR family oxidoreductase (plasmid) [Shinella sp. PSBB067]|uniref:SDR family NAD(P)-dependent oxidoreductase n=1 Tax=Shinella sp. PSBB067 TaxID=2715959 RepID=UPI00193B4686|nr:SDR family oxidoreductase [Shinella sp. PSBB067]QRI66386.1 SDR family oxidoreductase [Shinella sp. PSBB067]